MPDDCQVFLSYRRSDAAGHARALHRDLIRRFDPGQVFFDRKAAIVSTNCCMTACVHATCW
jgi:hypothetical protein